MINFWYLSPLWFLIMGLVSFYSLEDKTFHLNIFYVLCLCSSSWQSGFLFNEELWSKLCVWTCTGSKTSVAECRPLPKCQYWYFGGCRSRSAFDWHLDGLGVLTDIDGCPNTNEMPIQIGIHPKCRYRHLGSGRHFVTEVMDPGQQV